MPYIKNENNRREELQHGSIALNAGELNYQIFYYFKHNEVIDKKVVEKYVENFVRVKVCYQRYNDMTGCLVRCGLEIERRLNKNSEILLDIMESYNDEINKYENLKIKENGDVE